MSERRAVRSLRAYTRGVTLLELVIAIVVIGIAVAGTAQVFTLTTGRSADPLMRQQALLIAEAYMEEILLKRMVDPDTNTVCSGVPVARNLANSVCEYNGINDTGARDQFGNAIPGLTDYTVTVAVVAAGAALNGVNNGGGVIRVVRVDVTVTGPGATTIALTGYRTNYNCNAAGDPGCTAT